MDRKTDEEDWFLPTHIELKVHESLVRVPVWKSCGGYNPAFGPVLVHMDKRYKNNLVLKQTQLQRGTVTSEPSLAGSKVGPRDLQIWFF